MDTKLNVIGFNSEPKRRLKRQVNGFGELLGLLSRKVGIVVKCPGSLGLGGI